MESDLFILTGMQDHCGGFMFREIVGIIAIICARGSLALWASFRIMRTFAGGNSHDTSQPTMRTL